MSDLPEPLLVRTTIDPDAVGHLRNVVVDFARRAGADDRFVDGVRLAMSEVLSNVVVHAYADAGSRGPVQIEVRVTDGDLIAVVCDEGSGMRPRADSPGLGLGLPLVANVAKDFRVSDRESGGTQVAMRFALGSAA